MSPRQEQRFAQMQREKELVKAMAFDVASQYCRENGLSVEKLRAQRFEWLAGIACFAQPRDVKPEGLLNDLQTQPYPTLLLKIEDGKVIVEQTKHTKAYLS